MEPKESLLAKAASSENEEKVCAQLSSKVLVSSIDLSSHVSC